MNIDCLSNQQQDILITGSLTPSCSLKRHSTLVPEAFFDHILPREPLLLFFFIGTKRFDQRFASQIFK